MKTTTLVAYLDDLTPFLADFKDFAKIFSFLRFIKLQNCWDSIFAMVSSSPSIHHSFIFLSTK
jgi:hypothetical protein